MRNAALGNFQARRFFSGRYLAESNRRERICSPVHSHFAKVPRCVLSVKVRQRYQEFSALPNEVRRVSCRSVFGSGALCVFWRLWLPRGEGLRKEGYPSLNKASFGGCREIQTETISSVCIFFLFHTDRGIVPVRTKSWFRIRKKMGLVQTLSFGEKWVSLRARLLSRLYRDTCGIRSAPPLPVLGKARS